MTDESIIGTSGKIIRVRTIRRQVYPKKYKKQLMDVISAYPWTSPTTTQTIQPAMLPLANPQAASHAIGTQTAVGQQAMKHADSSATATTVADSSSAVHNQWCPRNGAQQQHHQWQHHHQQFHDKHYQCHYSILQPPPAKALLTKRTQDEATGEAESKQARTQQEPKAKERAQEHTRTKGDKTKDRRSHNYNKERREDYSSIKRRQRRDWKREDVVGTTSLDTEGLDKNRQNKVWIKKQSQWRNKVSSKKLASITFHNNTEQHHRLTMVPTTRATKSEPEQWPKESLKESMIAMTFSQAHQYSKSWESFWPWPSSNNVSSEQATFPQHFYMHQQAATISMWPPAELYGQHSTILWQLLSAIYGPRASPKSWQDFLADVLQQLGLTRLVSEPNVYRNEQQTVFVMAYGLCGWPFVSRRTIGGQQDLRSSPAQERSCYDQQEHTYGKTISFLGRNLTNKGDHIDITLAPDYIETVLKRTQSANL